jgi:hypothetical protein
MAGRYKSYHFLERELSRLHGQGKPISHLGERNRSQPIKENPEKQRTEGLLMHHERCRRVSPESGEGHGRETFLLKGSFGKP